MCSDIRETSWRCSSDNYDIAKHCYDFWVNKYSGIANLMQLINLIGWFCSFLGKPVYYSIKYFTTVQA